MTRFEDVIEYINTDEFVSKELLGDGSDVIDPKAGPPPDAQ
jgi:hypothetical protein